MQRLACLLALVPLLCAVFVTSGGTTHAGADGLLEIGKPLPELFLPPIDGGPPVNLAELRGRKLILQVFASW